MCLAADPWVESSILARSHTFTEIDREIISAAILLSSVCCQLQGKVCALSTGKRLSQACPGKKWLGELADPT